MDLLEEVIDSWLFVQNENNAHKEYVSSNDWNTWVSFDEKVMEKLRSIVEDSPHGVSEASNAYLVELKATIAKAPRKSAEELKLEKAGFNETDEIQNIEATVKKTRLLDKLLRR